MTAFTNFSLPSPLAVSVVIVGSLWIACIWDVYSLLLYAFLASISLSFTLTDIFFLIKKLNK